MDQAGDAVPIADLLDERRHLLNVAYWMLGTGPEAEDAVTQAYRQWYDLSDLQKARITDPGAWLTETTGSICLARLVLPERGPTGPGGEDGDAVAGLHQAWEEEISGALLDALEALSPTERAAFVLNDVFAMPPRAVAGIVGRTPHECAELADRARRSVRRTRSHPTTPQQHDMIVRAVRRACATADATHLASLLAPDATAFFDGGGKVRALTRPVHGNQHVARTLLTLLTPRPRTTLHLSPANGRTAIVVRHNAQVAAVISFDIADHHVFQVWAVLNPDKLRTWNRPHTPGAPTSTALGD
ncbi:RNA polymerase subunit sigma [Streptomyces sp. NPDC004457]